MALLKRENLLMKEELERVQVFLDDENYICVRQMTGRERDHFEQSLIKEKYNKKGEVIGYEKSLEDFRAKLAICTACDDEGNALFKSGDAAALSQSMSAAKLEKIVNAAQKLNAISEEDKEAMVKNSEVGLADNSNSDSVEN